MKILTIPDKKLREKSKLVDKIDKKVKKFIYELSQTLSSTSNPPGVGLSAIQVGKPLQIFLTYMPKDLSMPIDKWHPRNLNIETYINPRFESLSSEITLGPNKKRPTMEGCLSMPNIYGPVFRHKWIELSYVSLDENQIPVEKITKFEDFPARVVQHEFDHLTGTLFTDHSLEDGLPVYEERDDELVEIDFA